MAHREREILRKLDQRTARLDRWIEETGTPALMEIRTELEVTRISYEHQLELTRTLVDRNMKVIDEAVEAIRELRAEVRNNSRVTERLERSMKRIEQRLFGDGPAPAAT